MSEMKYIEIPFVNKQVSRILFGTAISDMMDGGDAGELLDGIFELGINTFDTARSYGLSEKSLGNWIESRENRDKVVILTKGAHPSEFRNNRVTEKDISNDIVTSLMRLKTDYVDIYLLHRDNPDVEVGPIVEVLNRLHCEGKIGAFGGSNWTHQRIAAANEYAYKNNLIPFSLSSPFFSLADQITDPWGGGGGCISIAGPSNNEARKWYTDNKMPVIAYSSLGRGMLSGKVKSDEPKDASKILDGPAFKGYCFAENFERLRRVEKIAAEKGHSVSQIALAWVLQQPMNVCTVCSARSTERMESNIEALHIELTEEELLFLDLRN